MCSHCFVDNQAGTHHGTLGVADYGIHVGVFIERLEHIVHGIMPNLLVPVFALAAARIKKAVQRPSAKVVLPSCRRLDFV